MPDWGTALLIGGVIGLMLGYHIAGKSAAAKPIRGGFIAAICNFIAAAAVASVAPTLLIGSIILHIKIGGELILAVGLTLVSAIALIVFGFVEARAGT